MLRTESITMERQIIPLEDPAAMIAEMCADEPDPEQRAIIASIIGQSIVQAAEPRYVVTARPKPASSYFVPHPSRYAL